MKKIFQYFVIFSIFFFISGFYRSIGGSINANILYLVFCALSLPIVFLYGNFHIPAGNNLKFFSAFFIFIIYMIFNLIIVDLTPIGIQVLNAHIYCIILYFVSFNVIRSLQSRNFLQNFYNLFGILLIFSSIFIFIEGFIQGYGIANTGTKGRGDGFFLNPNHASFMLVMQYALFSEWSKMKHIKESKLDSLILILVFLGIIASFSKGSLIVFLCLFFYKFRNTNLLYTLPVFIFLSLVLIFFNDIRFFLEFNDLIGKNTLDRIFEIDLLADSVDNRIQVIPYAFSQFLNAPIFGNGLGYNYAWQFNYASHNIFLFYLVDLGLVGLSICLVMLSQLWVRLKYVALVFFAGSFFSHNVTTVVEVYLLISLLFIIKDFEERFNLNQKIGSM